MQLDSLRVQCQHVNMSTFQHVNNAQMVLPSAVCAADSAAFVTTYPPGMHVLTKGADQPRAEPPQAGQCPHMQDAAIPLSKAGGWMQSILGQRTPHRHGHMACSSAAKHMATWLAAVQNSNVSGGLPRCSSAA
jgi:hypothetical protein